MTECSPFLHKPSQVLLNSVSHFYVSSNTKNRFVIYRLVLTYLNLKTFIFIQVSIEDKVVDFDPNGIQMNEKASPEELKDVHVRLQEEIINLSELETQLFSEIETLERRVFELKVIFHKKNLLIRNIYRSRMICLATWIRYLGMQKKI